MQLGDLRIGNCVKVNDEIVIVTSINFTEELITVTNTNLGALQHRYEDVNIQPVMLEAFMLRQYCGFDKTNRLKFMIDEHVFYLHLTNGYIVLEDQRMGPVIKFFEVNSFHKLQNLYHAFKHEQLNIELK